MLNNLVDNAFLQHSVERYGDEQRDEHEEETQCGALSTVTQVRLTTLNISDSEAQ